jgi:hypothetical protein
VGQAEIEVPMKQELPPAPATICSRVLARCCPYASRACGFPRIANWAPSIARRPQGNL